MKINAWSFRPLGLGALILFSSIAGASGDPWDVWRNVDDGPRSAAPAPATKSTIVSTTWRIVATGLACDAASQPDPRWVDPSFDDGAWNETVLPDVDTVASQAEGELLLRGRFTATPGQPHRLTYSSNELSEVVLNGVPLTVGLGDCSVRGCVGATPSCTGPAGSLDLTPFLVSGTNLLAVRVRKGGRCSGSYFDAQVTAADGLEPLRLLPLPEKTRKEVTCPEGAVGFLRAEEPPPGGPATITVSGTISFTCEDPQDASVLDFILILDDSGSMYQGVSIPSRNSGAFNLIESIPTVADVQGAVVGFGSFAELETSYTPDRSKLKYAVVGTSINGGTDTAAGLRLALNHSVTSSRPQASEFFVLFSDGMWNGGEDPAIPAAEAGLLGVPVHTLFLGNSPDGRASMEQIAVASGGTFAVANDPNQLPDLFRQVGAAARVATIEVTSSAAPGRVFLVPRERIVAGYWSVEGIPVTRGGTTRIGASVTTRDAEPCVLSGVTDFEPKPTPTPTLVPRPGQVEIIDALFAFQRAKAWVHDRNRDGAVDASDMTRLISE